DMYIMMDQSYSMNDSVGAKGTKWDNITKALKQFVGQSPLTDGIGIGIQYFGGPSVACNATSECPADEVHPDTQPHVTCNPNKTNSLKFCYTRGSCDPKDYAKADVDIDLLPGAAAKISASLDAHAPATQTPTGAALQAAIDYATTWATAHTDHTTIVVLA